MHDILSNRCFPHIRAQDAHLNDVRERLKLLEGQARRDAELLVELQVRIGFLYASRCAWTFDVTGVGRKHGGWESQPTEGQLTWHLVNTCYRNCSLSLKREW